MIKQHNYETWKKKWTNNKKKVMDENGDGEVSLEELQQALRLPEHEAKIIFEEADLNGDGVIRCVCKYIFKICVHIFLF